MTQVTREAGARHAVWSHDGKRIYFVDKGDNLQSVSIAIDPQLTISEPRLVADFGDVRAVNKQIVPLPDGESFAFVQKGDKEREAKHLNVVLDWFKELEVKVPTGAKQ